MGLTILLLMIAGLSIMESGINWRRSSGSVKQFVRLMRGWNWLHEQLWGMPIWRLAVAWVIVCSVVALVVSVRYGFLPQPMVIDLR
jgi:hypothetical protein